MDGRMALDGSRAELIMNLSSFSPGNEGSVPVRIVNGTIYIDFSALVRGLHHSPRGPAGESGGLDEGVAER